MPFITLCYAPRLDARANHNFSSSAASTPASSRPRRSGASATANNVSSAIVQRGLGSADDRRQSLKLTVKAPPSKLREVMRANEVESLHDTLGGGQVLDTPRSSRRTALAARTSARGSRRPTYAEYGESDIEDEEEEDDEEEDDDDEDEEEEPNDFDQLGAEPEGDTDDEDVEMEDAPAPPPPSRRHLPPKPPKITLKPPAKGDNKSSAKPKLIVTPAKVGPLKSVEEQEMEDASEDVSDEDEDEVGNSSELSDEDEEPTINVHDEDAEGEEEEIVVEEDAPGEDEEADEEDEDDDELDDSSDETPASGAATPDLSKMTKRQRGRPEDQGTLMALDMAPQQRKFFTDEEKAMKKDEHARKRKELTKRKVQEEKTAALNRLLKPQVSKARGAAPKPETLAAAAAAAAAAGSPYEEEELPQRANPLYTRWVSTQDGVRLGVPEEWLGKKVGRYFGPPLPSSSNILIQEVE
ncbi:uncharacterized protein Z520_06723 [Fonsecaea multimorphosa CBS 102226]|uniref:INO80 complex subunit B-like conserved region domain-containing protein n=1 Tax=Fonsecaea multimorphosa CBS 102226 TaxID=1442371 RepID=A0A0D2IJM9_9EURO|nr:uncharacterized protein Z520_06723 [Fonsecaea multimorphosa CBS 102226]KIX97271.1 hypothetical protein Z520_06723 [Fonsecaea multimorphosa CBS 102226]OAL23239.1 hypothetical protein AYO22_06289 [Fonsecaea multimorphosa]